MKRGALAVGFLVLVTVRSGWAADQDVNKLLEPIGEKLAGYKTWSADYVQTMNMMGNQMTMNGHVTYQQPAEMRMEMQMPMMGQTGTAVMVMGKDRVMWQDMNVGGQRRVMKMDMKAMAGQPGGRAMAGADPSKDLDPRQQIEQMKSNYDLVLLPSQELQGQTMHVLEGTFKTSATNDQQLAMAKMFSKVRMYIGKDDAFVHKTEMIGKTGDTVVMSQEFKNLKFNQDLPTNIFVFTPPEGVQVMDMTEMLKQMHGGPNGAPSAPPPPPASAPAAPPAAEPAPPATPAK